MNLGDLALELARAATVILPILLPGVFFIVCLKRNWLKIFDHPIDFGLSLGKSRIFGENKNWRGAMIYVLGGTFLTLLLHQLAPAQSWVAPIYMADPWLLGPICTSAYVVGELVNSFVKRRLGIGPAQTVSGRFGKTVQNFFDNADGTIAYSIALQLLIRPSGNYLWIALLLALAIHASTDVLMRKLRLKKKN
ncbi:MAG: CDP-archaeol synthase [Rhodoluna sp.]